MSDIVIGTDINNITFLVENKQELVLENWIFKDTDILNTNLFKISGL